MKKRIVFRLLSLMILLTMLTAFIPANKVNFQVIKETSSNLLTGEDDETDDEDAADETDESDEIEEETPARNPGYAVDYNGIYFVGQVGSGASAETIPPDLDNPFSPLPAHDQFLIEDYESQNTVIEPIIRVIPLRELRETSAENAEEIDLLQSLLDDLPVGIPDDLPMLPAMNAGSLGAAQFSTLDFTSGSGVRYITQYAQAAWPVNNKGLFYTFQGITSDNAYYVSVLMSLAHDALNEYDDFQPEDDFYDTAAGLIGGQFLALDQVDGSSFIPSMVLLDQLVQSISITRQEAVG